MATPFKLKIITPDKTFFEGETENVIVRTTEGDIGILAGHINYAASLPSGPIKVKMDDGNYRLAAISGGVLKISKAGTVIIARAIEWGSEIDLEHARRSEEDARRRMQESKGKSNAEFERARMKLMRALNRIDVAQKM